MNRIPSRSGKSARYSFAPMFAKEPGNPAHVLQSHLDDFEIYFTRYRLRYFQWQRFLCPFSPWQGEKVADRPDEGADLE